MSWSREGIRRLVKSLLALTLRVYYRSIQVQGSEFVPPAGAVLLVANHPNSLLDPAILVHLISRRVHFGAKHTLFLGPLKPVLEAFGAIPLVRAQDDRKAMRRNLQALERYVDLLKEGGMAAIFPEGLSQDEPHLAPLKTGAARIALQAEEGCAFKLNLKILPVGLQFEPRRQFRADAFVRFGNPFKIDDLAEVNSTNRRQVIQELTVRIDASLQQLSYHVETVEEVGFVERIVEVYLQRVRKTGLMGVDRRGLRGELLQKTASCLNHFAEADPRAVARIEHKLRRYERLRERAGIRKSLLEDPVGLLPGPLAPLQAAMEATLGLIPALFGTLTSAIPYYLTRTIGRLVTRRTQYLPALSFTHILTGLLLFPLVYGLQIWWIWNHFSQLVTVTFAALVVPCGLFALAYVERMRKLAVHVGGRIASWMKLDAVAHVMDARDDLLLSLDEMRDRYRVEVLGWAPLAKSRHRRILPPSASSDHSDGLDMKSDQRDRTDVHSRAAD